MGKTQESYSVGGLVFNPRGCILFVEEFNEYWGLPRGHVEDGEDNLSAIRREIYEESGIDNLTLICELGSYSRSTFDSNGLPNNNEIKHLSYYCFKTTVLELKPLDKDITDAMWLKPAEGRLRLINKDDLAFFDKSIKKIVSLGLL